MKLIFKQSGEEVKVGDEIIDDSGKVLTIIRADMPHKPSSSGIVIVQEDNCQRECYAQVFGLEWIEREDQGWVDPEIAKQTLLEYTSIVTEYEITELEKMSDKFFLDFVKAIPISRMNHHPKEVKYIIDFIHDVNCKQGV